MFPSIIVSFVHCCHKREDKHPHITSTAAAAAAAPVAACGSYRTYHCHLSVLVSNVVSGLNLSNNDILIVPYVDQWSPIARTHILGTKAILSFSFT